MAEATHAQHAVWFTEQAGVAGTAFGMAVGVWFDAGVDNRALRAACDAVISRHAALRCAVSVAEDGGICLEPTGQRPSVVVGEFTDERLSSELARPFDLRRGPLARFTVLRQQAGRQLLLVTVHHLVFDGMSKDILVRDLARGYNAAVANRPIDLGPAPRLADGSAVTNADVAAQLPGAREFWARRWVAPGDVVLPDLRRIPSSGESGAEVTFGLEPVLSDGLDKTAYALGLTRFELLLAAVHVVLGRYGNGLLPVTVGLSTRTPSTDEHIGLFVNELPVTVAPPVGTFREFAGQLRDQLREVYQFRAVALGSAVGGLRPTAALTPVSVGYRRRDAEPTFDGVDSHVEWAMFNSSASNALHAQIVDAPTGIDISLRYSPTAIPAGAVDRVGAHLRTVLAAVVADPDHAVATLPLLPTEELDTVLHAFNATDREHPADTTVMALFAARVKESPQAVAIVDADGTLTYADLDTASDRLAGLLRRRGVHIGSIVAVSMGRSREALVSLLAVMRASAAYVPVDPTYPAARRGFILADAAPDLVITTSAIARELRSGVNVLALDSIDALYRRQGFGLRAARRPSGPNPRRLDAFPGPAPSARDLAYVMYTSGSTGRPKGVAVSHRALANLLLGFGELLGSRPEDRWLGLTSLSFDISGLELYLPLVTGARVVLAPAQTTLDGAALRHLIREQGITHVQATPSAWRVLLDGAAAGTGREPVVALTGGEALPVGLARELRARVARLVNVYGPTETTIWSTAAEVSEPDRISIGRPIANTRAYVLDAHMRPVPIGVPGELYLGGSGLAEGYLHRPGLTADRFVPDPYGAPGGRLYRTGDRAQWTEDGAIAYRGRVDDQVKIRGHRVELGEIEANLLEHPSVAEAAVVLRGGDADVRLVGYVVPSGRAPAPAALREHLAQTLPAVMVPAVWVVLDRLPLTPNGKLDRAALPDPGRPPAAAQPSADSRGVDDVAEVVRTIWQEVLLIDDIGLDEDLFDLGAHSLTITRINGRIQQQLGVDLPLDVYFDTPTIAEVAAAIRQRVSAGR